MGRKKIGEKLQNVRLRVADLVKLKQYKVHPNQPYWDVVKIILNKEERENAQNP